MYNHIWKKYLPIIKILMKKSSGEDQVLDLNRVDFERAGPAERRGINLLLNLLMEKLEML